MQNTKNIDVFMDVGVFWYILLIHVQLIQQPTKSTASISIRKIPLPLNEPLTEVCIHDVRDIFSPRAMQTWPVIIVAAEHA